jgi:4-carboxymuconolactone decarboxylase
MADKALRDGGLAMRKKVLGDAYVEKSMKSADAFSAPFQEWLNEHCWGVAWTDQRLPPKTRSMLNIALLAGINRMHEWELHLNGALNNGVTREEVAAIIQHLAVYGGAPMAVECMRIARKVFAERDAKPAG